VDLFGVEKDPLGQCCLTGVDVRTDPYVPHIFNSRIRIHLHTILICPLTCDYGGLKCRQKEKF
jgi:hypothetical protein